MPPAFDWADALPTLPADRVQLRHLRDADVPALFTVFSDPEVMRYWSSTPMLAEAEATAYLASINAHFAARTLFQWGIARRDDDRVIGTCTLNNVDRANERAEIGYALAQAYWGAGLATETVRRVLAFAFRELGLYRIEADVDPRNLRSLAALERQGFRREGYLPARYFVGGERQDTVLLGLLRPDWEAQQP